MSDDNSVNPGPSGNAGAGTAEKTGAAEKIRECWDVDASTYDRSPSHYPQRPQEQAAWATTLRRLLPDPPASVLDMGPAPGSCRCCWPARDTG